MLVPCSSMNILHHTRPAAAQVRVRVDYSGFTTINTQRFGQTFVGVVANPNDIILWHKAPAKRQKASVFVALHIGYEGVHVLICCSIRHKLC